jgi:putative glycosyltransferase
MKLSIVTTLFKSSKYIHEFYTRISIEAQKITQDYEIIFIDDGSPDNSLQKAIELFENDKRIIVIELSRNFGHHKAIMTGLSHAKGSFIFLIDVDLEEEPELLGTFWEELNKNKDLDVVYGYQKNRKGNWFERWSGYFFYKFMNIFGDINLPTNLITSRLMTKDFKQALTLHKENEIFLGGLFVSTGFKQRRLEIKKKFNKKSTYSFKKKISLFVKAITSYTNFPLKLVFYFGLIFFVIALIMSANLLFNKFFIKNVISGWTSLIISIYLIGGLILISLGILGIYISKIVEETKKNPFTIIKKINKK